MRKSLSIIKIKLSGEIGPSNGLSEVQCESLKSISCPDVLGNKTKSSATQMVGKEKESRGRLRNNKLKNEALEDKMQLHNACKLPRLATKLMVTNVLEL
jgi:hypothetical protein